MEHTGTNVTNVIEVDYLYDTLFIERLYNMTLPEWTKKDNLMETMKKLRDLSFAITTWNEELKRLRSGPLIDDLVKSMLAFRKGILEPTEKRMHMYSGHDTTLSSLLNALELFDPPIAPPYASLIMVELTDKFKVRILYRNDTSVEPYLLMEKSLDEFDKDTRHLRPENWAKECQKGGHNDAVINVVSKVSLVIGALLAIGLVVAVAVNIKKRRRSFVDNDHGEYAALSQDTA